MHELELKPAERFLEEDPAWRRLFARIDPTVRGDIIGWMRLGSSRKSARPKGDSLRDVVQDCLEGASLAIDPLPRRRLEALSNDAALASDTRAVLDTISDVQALIIMLLVESEIRKLDRRPTRPSEPASRKRPVAAE
jgi:hypothetical protein